MATKYRKIDTRMWRDERFTRLSTEEKLVAGYCLTAQSNRCGIFVFSPAMAAEVTTAVAMGPALRARLERSGITFAVAG